MRAPHTDMLDVGRRLGYRGRRLEEACPDETRAGDFTRLDSTK